MIDVKQAIACAVQFLEEVMKRETIHDIRLEEVELSDDTPERWQVTLSFKRGAPDDVNLAKVLFPTEREYKAFEVLAGNGQVRSMRIRNPA
jgi:hypothetical protein